MMQAGLNCFPFHAGRGSGLRILPDTRDTAGVDADSEWESNRPADPQDGDSNGPVSDCISVP